MIKVMIVDDDKLVRKGLISAMPWQDFDMVVVGEASNGEKALELLETQSVDLLLTDLAMPVMSGIELIKHVRNRFPQIYIVVLTLHQDFEYIQEVLRLGVIDYIAKVQLEKERFEEVLARIHNRIAQESQKSANHNEKYLDDQAYILLSLNGLNRDTWVEDWNKSAEHVMVEVDLNLWLWVKTDDQAQDTGLVKLAQEIKAKPEWSLIHVNELNGRSIKDVHTRLKEFREKEFFYSYQPDSSIKAVALWEVNNSLTGRDEESLEQIRENWSAHEWIYQDAVFKSHVNDLKELRLSQPKLLGLLYALMDKWNLILFPVSSLKIQLEGSFASWHHVEAWFMNTRLIIRNAISKTSYSDEVMECIIKATYIAHEEMDQQITAASIAKRVNMSRSYFSQCFKEITGINFSDHLRRIRLEKAKEYLLFTNKTILWIAEHVGYLDDKYFSRTFREHVGMLPSEYRQKSSGVRDLPDK
ncbi:response regulator [Paenibacillus psychroresistens]|uniref:Response regulator n=1 Tax=Paenibacillus psychroresistens TaxID=1778678 RepID=A0A6B8RTE1_9BACL|nr:response regulator [Paenibacillus psychroresistens]QGQ98723.1 response regulator [Paenibacillus psychroresistens]